MPQLEQVQTQLRGSAPWLPPAQKTVPICGLRVQTQKTPHTCAPTHRCVYTMMPISVEQDSLFPVCRDACIKRPLLSLLKEVEIRSRQKLLLAKEVWGWSSEKKYKGNRFGTDPNPCLDSVAVLLMVSAAFERQKSRGKKQMALIQAERILTLFIPHLVSISCLHQCAFLSGNNSGVLECFPWERQPG